VHTDTCLTDTQITGTLKASTLFFIIPHSIILLTRNFTDKSCRENQNTHLCSVTFFENCAIYEIMCTNIIDSGRPRMMMWHLRIACYITKATDTHSEYVILTAFALQQWLHKRASMLHYKYIACLI
jgi:hypothetical protein